MSTRLKFAPIAICVAFGLAACGDDGASTSTDGATTPVDAGDGGGYNYGPEPTTANTDSPTTVAVTAAPTTVAAGPAVVELADSEFGPILVDADGNTLYLFTPDSATAATCTGGCANTWPPFLLDSVTSVGDGLSLDLFTTVAGEGGLQVAYNGHPLYYFAGDSAPGDTNGQGSSGVWYVVDADGNAVEG